MNKGWNVVQDGERGYMNKRTGQMTKISHEDGQYTMYMGVPSGPKAAQKETTSPLKGNRFAIVAIDEDQVFSRPVGST